MCTVLDRSADFRFQAQGYSMSPFIKNYDIITISPVFQNKVATGDIVVVLFRDKRSVLVHRIIDRNNGQFIIKGDNNKSDDGFFKTDQIIGVVTKVERNGRKIWYGRNKTGKLIAFLSKTGLLNSFILPVLRFFNAPF